MAASLRLWFGSNYMRVRQVFSSSHSHPETDGELGWNSPMGSPKLSRYFARTYGRGWPYLRGGLATFKSSVHTAAYISFLL